jgi:hypothetical protein
MYLRHRDLKKSRNQQTKDDHPHGEQTVKDLIGQNQGVTSIPLDDIRIRDFSQAARKYGVALCCDKGQDNNATQICGVLQGQRERWP